MRRRSLISNKICTNQSWEIFEHSAAAFDQHVIFDTLNSDLIIFALRMNSSFGGSISLTQTLLDLILTMITAQCTWWFFVKADSIVCDTGGTQSIGSLWHSTILCIWTSCHKKSRVPHLAVNLLSKELSKMRDGILWPPRWAYEYIAPDYCNLSPLLRGKATVLKRKL